MKLISYSLLFGSVILGFKPYQSIFFVKKEKKRKEKDFNSETPGGGRLGQKVE